MKVLYDRNLELLNHYIPKKQRLRTDQREDPKGVLKTAFIKIEKLMTEDKRFKEPNLSIADLVEAIGVNERYISQAISLYSGKTFYQFLHFYRINEARKCLAEAKPDVQIKEVMYDCGYQSRTTFVKAFKEFTGMTPTQFKERSVIQASGKV